MNYLDSLQNSGSSFQMDMINNSPGSPVTLGGDKRRLLVFQVMTYLCDVTKISDLKWLFLIVITLEVSLSKLKYFRLNTKGWVISKKIGRAKSSSHNTSVLFCYVQSPLLSNLV